MLTRLQRLVQPHAQIAAALQQQFQLARRPSCRRQHSRFEIVVRGAGLSTQSVDACIAIAEAMSEAVRPLLATSHLMLTRRSSRFAIRVRFEDEQVVAGGVATTSIAYVATVGDASGRLPPLLSRRGG